MTEEIIKICLMGKFNEEITPKIKAEITEFNCNNDYGNIKFDIIDYPKEKKYLRKVEDYWKTSDAAIFTFDDILEKNNYDELIYMVSYFKYSCQDKPFILCHILDEDITEELYIEKRRIEIIKKLLNEKSNYFDISNLNNTNLYEPLLYITRILKKI